MAEEPETHAEQIPEDKPKVVFTEEQQAFIDERFSKRYAEIKAKHETEIKELNAKHRKELERSKMDEADRIKAEESERMDELTKRAEEAERKLRIAETEKELAKAGLPTELASTILGATDEDTRTAIAALDRAVKERANTLYAERVGTSGAPQAPAGGDPKLISMQATLRAAAGLPPKGGTNRWLT